MKKYVKVMFGQISGADKNLHYKLNEINIASNWNPNEKDPKEMGGFNFGVEDKILGWLVRGDTLYEIEIPEDAEVIEVENEFTTHGVFRSNKIILRNPVRITDKLAMKLYKKQTLPEKSYYKTIADLAVRGHKNTAMQIIKDKVNKDNIDLVLKEVNDFLTKGASVSEGNQQVTNETLEKLNKIKE